MIKMSVKLKLLPLIAIIIIGILIIPSACSNSKNNKEDKEQNDSLVSTTHDTEINPLCNIAIFSKDYQLIKEIKYQCKQKDWQYYHSYIEGYPTSDTLVGDFNGDGKQELAWFTRSETYQSYIKNNECIGSFEFSNKKIRPLQLGNCCGGTFKNEGDLDGNGTDEIGVMCYWPTGSCRVYYVYTFHNNEWEVIFGPIESSHSMREAGIVLIEKDSTQDGYVIVRNMLYFNDKSMPEKYREQGGGSCISSNVMEFKIKVSDSD